MHGCDERVMSMRLGVPDYINERPDIKIADDTPPAPLLTEPIGKGKPAGRVIWESDHLQAKYYE